MSLEQGPGGPEPSDAATTATAGEARRKLLNVNEAAAYCDRSRLTIRRYRQAGLLPDKALWTREELDHAMANLPPRGQRSAPKKTTAPAEPAPEAGEVKGDEAGTHATPSSAPEPSPSAPAKGKRLNLPKKAAAKKPARDEDEDEDEEQLEDELGDEADEDDDQDDDDDPTGFGL